MRLLCIAIASASALLGACQPAGDLPPASVDHNTANPSGDAPAAALASLNGEYRVVGIDGTDVSGGIGIALTVTDSLIWFDPRCAGFNWTYTFKDGALTTDRPHKPRAPGGPLVAGPMVPTCRIAVHAEQQRLATAMDAVTEARRTISGGIELRGNGHSVTLFSQ